MISVILPVYNGDKYLRQSIDSVLNQTYSDLELIIVDDGSADTTWEIMQEYRKKDPRVRTICHSDNGYGPKNFGLPAALNTGYRASKGDLITWTSHDNWYLPDALQCMAENMRATNADLVYAGCKVISGTAQSNFLPAPPEKIVEFNVVHACFLHKREVYNKIGDYDENLFRAEDWDYWLRAYAAGFRFIPLNRVLYWYRDHPDSLTWTRRDLCIRQARKVFRKNIGNIRLSPWQRVRAEGVNLIRGYV